MDRQISRRQFVATTLASLPMLPMAGAWAAPSPKPYSFILLGDLHLDKIEHHDEAWMQKEKAGDWRQVQNYSRISRDITPKLFAAVRDKIAELNRTPDTQVSFVLQVGDFVEGLCGTLELATRHHQDAIDFVSGANLGVPFVFTKGNHDVTGPGAIEAYRNVFHPYLSQQAAKIDPSVGELKSARYLLNCGNAQFAFFDAYDKESLDWFEATAKQRSAEHFFTVVHPPVVPYGARATWYLYAKEKERKQRDKLLEILAKQNAIVLGGHIHRFNSLVRNVGNGRFTQLAVSSVVGSLDVQPKDVLDGTAEYTGDQIRVEPSHSPDTEKERRAVYDAERQFVSAFQYADLPGYAVVNVDGPTVTAAIYPGLTQSAWKSVNLITSATG